MGAVPLDDARLAAEVERIACGDGDAPYSEYVFGSWRSRILARPAGASSRFQPAASPLEWTPLGREVPAIRELVERTVDVNRVRWARAFVQGDGLLISHLDFVEFAAPTVRLGLPVETGPGFLHVSGDEVFSMRPGELWYLDPRVVHGARGHERGRRLTVVLDFDGTVTRPEEVVLPPAACRDVRPLRLERPALTGEARAELVALGRAMRPDNVRDAVRTFGEVPYRYAVGADAVFDLLQEAAAQSGQPFLVDLARRYRRYCIEHRGVEERFTFPALGPGSGPMTAMGE